MKTDALARRLRFAPPQTVVRRLVLSPADYLMFEALDRHGPLPTHYLYEFTKHLRRDYTHLQNRLTEFYNGDAQGPYLVRPPQQFAGFEARYQHVVYDLAARAKIALAEHGTLGTYSPRRSDPFLHRLMGACVAASFERGATETGVRYIPREEILSHPRCLEGAQRAKNHMAIPIPGTDARTLIPDDLFGLEYPGAGFRFFAVEIDRNTESIERSNLDQSAFGKKITAYLTLLRTKAFRSWWGTPNLSILTVTTNAVHARNMLAHVDQREAPQFAPRFAFKVEPSFGINWRVPRRILSDLLDTPWMAVSGPRDVGRP